MKTALYATVGLAMSAGALSAEEGFKDCYIFPKRVDTILLCPTGNTITDAELMQDNIGFHYSERHNATSKYGAVEGEKTGSFSVEEGGYDLYSTSMEVDAKYPTVTLVEQEDNKGGEETQDGCERVDRMFQVFGSYGEEITSGQNITMKCDIPFFEETDS